MFEEYFEKINPAETAEKLTENVILRAEKQKKVFRPKFIGLAAAAAAVMTFGVTAAATGFDCFAVFRDIFGEKAENLTENTVEAAEVTINNTKKMDFELVAVASDKQSVLAIIDVTAKNGFKMGQNNITGDVRADISWLSDVNPGFVGGMGGHINVLEAGEDKSRISIRMSATDEIEGQEITISIYEEPAPADPDIEPNWQVKFVAEGSSLEYTIENGNKVRVSPISISISGTNIKKEWSFGNLTVTMENGEKEMLKAPSGGGVTGGNKSVIFRFSEPINPEEVTEISIGQETFKLK
ncbi:MAG: hypothetical protein IJZ65_10795 [Ruminiclostridium sp.]|nr:hypothetical protein [Ruminiclostridium sp.]